MARALYDFTPQREDELAFKAGDEMVTSFNNIMICIFLRFSCIVHTTGIGPQAITEWVGAGRERQEIWVCCQGGGVWMGMGVRVHIGEYVDGRWVVTVCLFVCFSV